MHAIGHEVHDRFPRKRVVYLTSEQFTNEVISSMATARMGEFRNKYRTVDVLLIGDVQCLAGQELDVVDEQHVDRAVLVPELAHPRGGDGADDLIGELLRSEVDDALAREAVVHLMADRVHEVSLAETHASIEEKRVVAVAPCLGDGLGCGMGELRVVPDHERRKLESNIAPGRLDGGTLRRRLHPLPTSPSGVAVDSKIAVPRPEAPPV